MSHGHVALVQRPPLQIVLASSPINRILSKIFFTLEYPSGSAVPNCLVHSPTTYSTLSNLSNTSTFYASKRLIPLQSSMTVLWTTKKGTKPFIVFLDPRWYLKIHLHPNRYQLHRHPQAGHPQAGHPHAGRPQADQLDDLIVSISHPSGSFFLIPVLKLQSPNLPSLEVETNSNLYRVHSPHSRFLCGRQHSAPLTELFWSNLRVPRMHSRILVSSSLPPKTRGKPNSSRHGCEVVMPGSPALHRKDPSP